MNVNCLNEMSGNCIMPQNLMSTISGKEIGRTKPRKQEWFFLTRNNVSVIDLTIKWGMNYNRFQNT